MPGLHWCDEESPSARRCADPRPRGGRESPFGKVVYKPKRIEFSDTTLSKIHWKHWNRKIARGTGRARINTCNPNCAAGAIVHGTAKLAMFKRHTQNGKRFYGCLTGKMTASGHVYRVEWPPACNH